MMKLNQIVFHCVKFLFLVLLLGCANHSGNDAKKSPTQDQEPELTLMVLGVMQDGGLPHMACQKSCCLTSDFRLRSRKGVVSLGLYDHRFDQRYLFEATPDLTQQWQQMLKVFPTDSSRIMDGIFLTHAHIGHYTGLALLGKEVMAADAVPVYAMPKMREFLRHNGPWDQLIDQNNIRLMPLDDQKPLMVNANLKVTAFLVPHRDEYSETVGFRISGPNKSALFIPDIDKWNRWDQSIVELIKSVDYAFLDATFFDGNELPNRDMNQVPHPFVVESTTLFQSLSAEDRAKVHFIHINHTNPIANPESGATKTVLEAGFQIAREGVKFSM